MDYYRSSHSQNNVKLHCFLQRHSFQQWHNAKPPTETLFSVTQHCVYLAVFSNWKCWEAIEDIISRHYSPSHSCQKHVYFRILFLPRLKKFIPEYLKQAFASISQIVFHLAYHIDNVYVSWACPLQPLLLGYVGNKSTES